jgi:hypothetical protein
MRLRITTFGSMTVILLLLTFASGLYAQGECAAAIQAAFEQLREGCAGAGGNSACYGSGVTAELADVDAPFAALGDTVDLGQVGWLQTLPISADESGLALLNVHANVPLAVSEQGLKYLMVGNIELENAVDAASAFTPAPSITVTTVVAANLRSAPTTDGQVLGSVSVGAELPADGLSGDGGWLRVWYNDQLAWVSRQIVTGDGIDALPTLGSNANTLMQSFYLRNGGAASSCSDAPPSMLLIEAPGGMDATITANGATIRFDGAIGLAVLDDNTMQIVVFNGSANVAGVPVLAGFTVNVPLTEDGRGVGGLATGLRPITDSERTVLSRVADNLPDGLLYTPVNVPSQGEINAILTELNSAAGAQTVVGPAASGVDCSRFRPTSPLGSLVLGMTPFYWDAAPGATSYRVNVFGEDGSVRTSLEIDSNNTTLVLNTGGAIGEGINFGWNVEALVNGQVACTTGTINLPRDLTPQLVGEGSGQTVPDECTWKEC